MTHFSKWIPSTIIALRLEKGLSQQELAQRCGLSSAASISHFETGERLPSIVVLDRIFTVLGVTLTLGFSPDNVDLSRGWIYVRKDTIREIAKLIDEIRPNG